MNEVDPTVTHSDRGEEASRFGTIKQYLNNKLHRNAEADDSAQKAKAEHSGQQVNAVSLHRELDYFHVGRGYGWNQEWFSDRWMNLGGCAAVTAIESCIYLKKYRGLDRVYPFKAGEMISQSDYVRFSEMMKPYLRPRWSGIDTLQIYTEGLGDYFQDRGETGLTMEGFDGNRPLAEAKAAVIEQIDKGFPIPYLILEHRNPSMADYVWHWFLLNGYEKFEDTLMVKVVTYGTWRWLSLEELWATGYRRKGGLILFQDKEELSEGLSSQDGANLSISGAAVSRL